MPTADTPEEHLLEQVEFLRTHAASFDAGRDHFAKPLAHVLRTLLHQTAKSHALLVTLDARDQMAWFDPAEKSMSATCSLASPSQPSRSPRKSARMLGGQLVPARVEARYSPSLRPNDRVLPPVRFQVAELLRLGRKPWRTGDWLSFSDWWEQEVVAIDEDGARVSRKDLILAMAHKEGGSHIDTDMGAAYRKLTRANGLGYFYGTVGLTEELRVEPDPVPAAIRQIAYEVDASLSRQFPEFAVPG